MKTDSKNIETLLQRLQEMGIEPNLITGCMKDLANSRFLNRDMTYLEANERLKYLGWDDIELDYHTL